MDPHRPAFSPVATNSNARSVENVDAIYYPYGLIGVQTIVAPGIISFHVITPTSPVLNVKGVAGADILAVPTIVTDPLRIIKLFPDAVTLASAVTVTLPVPKTSGVFGASRFAVPTIVTVPIPSVN